MTDTAAEIMSRGPVYDSYGKPVAHSLHVAEASGKHHWEVIEGIRQILRDPDVAQLGHFSTSHICGDTSPCFEMDATGLRMIQAKMGLTGLAKFDGLGKPEPIGVGDMMRYAVKVEDEKNEVQRGLSKALTEADGYRRLSEELEARLKAYESGRIKYPTPLEPAVEKRGKSYTSDELTEMGLLGKDDAFRWFPECWQEKGKLAKRDDFFSFVRRELELERSNHRHPRLRATVIREDLAGVFNVRGPAREPKGPTVNLVPPLDTPPQYRIWQQIRLTSKGLRYLANAWCKR